MKINYLNLKWSINRHVKKLSVLVVMCFIGSNLNAQKSVRIGYIDTEYVLENIDEYSIANTQLDSKVNQWKAEIEKRTAFLENEKEKLINEQVLLTNKLISEREEDIQIIENEIIDYQQKRFGPGGDLIIQKKQLIQPIQDQIFTAVQEIASSKKYDFIFDKSADVIMLYSADKYDISEQVLRTINRASKRTQLETKKERKKAKEEETIVEEDSGKSERQKILDARKAERKALLDKKREEQLMAKEVRKKELEAKRQKKIEDRENDKVRTNSSSPLTDKKIESESSSTERKLSDKEERVRQIEARKENRKALLEKKRQENLEIKEARKKEFESETEDSTEEIAKEQKSPLEDIKKETVDESSNEKKLSPKEKRKQELEERKKALKEKRKKLLDERRFRAEAQRKKRDSIKNNK